MKLPLLIPPLLAFLVLWPASLAVSRGQAPPIGFVPNGDFHMAVSGDFSALEVVPGNGEWLLDGVGSPLADDTAPKLSNPLGFDAEEGPELRLGYAMTAVISPWIDVPRGAQAIGVWMRAEAGASDAGADLSLVDTTGTETHNTLVDVTNAWQRYLVPVSGLAGSSTRMRIHPLLSNSSLLDVGHVQPEMLLPSWTAEQDRGPLQLSLNRDDQGSFVTLEPSSYPGDEAWLVSSLFSPASACSQLEFSARATKSHDTLDAVLTADGDDQPWRVYELGSTWQTYSIPLEGMASTPRWALPLLKPEHALRLRVGVRPTSEIGLRDFTLREAGCGGSS